MSLFIRTNLTTHCFLTIITTATTKAHDYPHWCLCSTVHHVKKNVFIYIELEKKHTYIEHAQRTTPEPCRLRYFTPLTQFDVMPASKDG